MAASEMLLTLPQKSTREAQLHPIGNLSGLLSVDPGSTSSTSSQTLRSDILAADAFSTSPKQLSSSNALLSSWLQGNSLRGTGQLFGTANGCVLPPVGELQRSNSGLDILGMLNCSRLQGNSAASQDNFIDFSVLPKIQSLEQGMVRQHLADYSKDTLSEVGLPHLSVSKVKVPFIDLKQNSNNPSVGTNFSLDGSLHGSALVDNLVQNVSSQPSSSSGVGFVDTLTGASHGDLNLLGAHHSITSNDQVTNGVPSWNDVASLSKDWGPGAQEIGALLSSAGTFPDFAENIFSQCVEEIHCYKCKFCSMVYISLSKDDAISHFATSHAKEVEFLQRGSVAPSDVSWVCTDLMSRDYGLSRSSAAEESLTNPCLEPPSIESVPHEDLTQQQAASFVCGKCHKTFSSLKECQGHMANVHQVKSSRIREDKGPKSSAPKILAENEDQRVSKNGKPAVKKKDLKLKVMSKKRMKREHGCYICEFKGCNVRFRLLDNLQYHYKCHINGSNTFACPECSSSAQHWSSMAGHLWRQHVIDLELHACDQCSFRTYNLSLLENLHKRTHRDERPYLCDTCGKSFKTNKQLRSHKTLHSQKRGVHGLQSGECLVCRRRFVDKRMLRVHLDMVHKKMKPYLCNYCGYAASSKSTLRMHLRQHTGEKPFACQECDYRTADHNSLRRHKMRHSGEKPYKCPYCNYACIQSSTYKSHLKSKHPGQDKGLMFSCNVCSFHTIKEETYMTHVADHNLNALLTTASDATPQQQQQNDTADGHFLSLVEAVQISIAQPSDPRKVLGDVSLSNLAANI